VISARDPEISVPDPTEALIATMRQDVEARGAKFLVALDAH